MSSENVNKYQYLTSEDLNYKPITVEPAKFVYSPLNKSFNKWLKDRDKKEILLKRVKTLTIKTKSSEK